MMTRMNPMMIIFRTKEIIVPVLVSDVSIGKVVLSRDAA